MGNKDREAAGKDRRERHSRKGDKQSGCRTEGKTGGRVTSRVAARQRERQEGG
jgi:hypothetical protein